MKKEHSRLKLLNIICGVILLAGIAVLAAMIIMDYRDLSASRSEHISDTETTGSQQQTVPISTVSDSDTHILESVYTLDDPDGLIPDTIPLRKTASTILIIWNAIGMILLPALMEPLTRSRQSESRNGFMWRWVLTASASWKKIGLPRHSGN